MEASIRISLALMSSFCIFGCASTQKTALEERAGYDIPPAPSVVLARDARGRTMGTIPVRVPEKVAVAWLHAHELPSGDYFWGAWVSLVVAPEGWEMRPAPLQSGNEKRLGPTTHNPKKGSQKPSEEKSYPKQRL